MRLDDRRYMLRRSWNSVDTVGRGRINMDDRTNRNQPGTRWRPQQLERGGANSQHQKNPNPEPPQASPACQKVDDLPRA
jgi:hypothetical protein